MNSFGNIFRLTSFGESHGEAIGGVVDGAAAGVLLDIEKIQQELNRRRPGFSSLTSPRKEEDILEIISGLFEGVTTGAPIAFIVKNRNHNSSDYDNLKDVYRPSHSDFTWHKKYGIRDYRGGGRSSAREHISRVVGGAIARQLLLAKDIEIKAYISQIGAIKSYKHYSEIDIDRRFDYKTYCPDEEVSECMEALIEQVKSDGDSIGGVVSCVVSNMPIGVGEPVFDKLQSRLAAAMMSINAAKGFEYGMGFEAATMRGSEHNDPFGVVDGEIKPLTNLSGGIQGGISNGEDILFRVAFKPTSTIKLEQQTADINRNVVTISGEGRHDPCVAIRAVPVVEAMAAMVIYDLLSIK